MPMCTQNLISNLKEVNFNKLNTKNIIQFPKYTTQEKLDLTKQVQNVLLNHYVNLKVKIDDFGNSVDPTAELESLVDQAAGLSESELHSRISNLFFKGFKGPECFNLKDGHKTAIVMTTTWLNTVTQPSQYS